MSHSALTAGLRNLRSKLAAQECNDDSDEQLLRAFAAGRDDNAFAVLVRRHGPMVLHVCRRVLGHQQEAEDAFQATFVVLAKSAGKLRKKSSLASFLHGTAYRLALSGKRAAARRRKHEGSLGALTQPRSPANRGEGGVAGPSEERVSILNAVDFSGVYVCTYTLVGRDKRVRACGEPRLYEPGSVGESGRHRLRQDTSGGQDVLLVRWEVVAALQRGPGQSHAGEGELHGDLTEEILEGLVRVGIGEKINKRVGGRNGEMFLREGMIFLLEGDSGLLGLPFESMDWTSPRMVSAQKRV